MGRVTVAFVLLLRINKGYHMIRDFEYDLP